MTLTDFDERIQTLKIAVIALKLQGADLSKEVHLRYKFNTANYELTKAIQAREKWRRQQIVIERKRRKFLLQRWKGEQKVSAAASKKRG